MDHRITTETRPFALRFRLGELVLARRNLKVTELVSHFLEIPASLPDVLAFDPSPHGARCVLARSIPMDEQTPELASSGHKLVYVLARYRRSYVDMRQRSYEGYLSTFSSKSRSTLQRKVKKFQSRDGGTLDWSTARKTDEVDAFIEEALPLSRLTYQHRLLDSGLPEDDAFRAHLRELAAQNLFRGWILRLERRAVAYICSVGIGRTLLYEFVGFDPQFSALSPGTILQALVLQQLMQEQEFDYFDFTEGEGQHKEFFGTASTYCGDVLVAPNSWDHRLLLHGHRRFTRAERSAVDLLKRLGIKDRIKRFLRKSA